MGKALNAIVVEIERVGKMMDQMTQQNAALLEQASATSESLTDLAQEMDRMVSFFKQ